MKRRAVWFHECFLEGIAAFEILAGIIIGFAEDAMFHHIENNIAKKTLDKKAALVHNPK